MEKTFNYQLISIDILIFLFSRKIASISIKKKRFDLHRLYILTRKLSWYFIFSNFFPIENKILINKYKLIKERNFNLPFIYKTVQPLMNKFKKRKKWPRTSSYP